MNKSLDEIQAELVAFTKTIDILDKQFNDGIISETFYFKRRVSLVRDQEIIIKGLKGLLEQRGATEVSMVLDKVVSGSRDNEIEEEMKSAQEAGKAKRWGETFTQAINKEKGSIMQVALKAASKVAESLL